MPSRKKSHKVAITQTNNFTSSSDRSGTKPMKGHSDDSSSIDESAPEPVKEAERVCTTCKNPESQFPKPLQRCAQCHTQLYCSRECQKKDWKTHKVQCGADEINAMMEAFGLSAGVFRVPQGFKIDRPLSDMAEAEVYPHLIDAYRLRVEDEYAYKGDVDTGTLYGGANPLPHFRKFLSRAEQKPGLLPAWWNAAKRKKCEKMAVDKRQWSDINSAVEQSDISRHYDNPLMPMRLRALAERVYSNEVIPYD